MIDIDKLIKDYKGRGKASFIPHSKELTHGKKVSISKYSGLVSVQKRRSSKEIARDWSNKIFGKIFDKKNYSPKIPAVTARLHYVTETIVSKLKIKSKSICDIGAGEGNFLSMISNKKLSNNLFAIEPSEKNCKILKKNKIKNFTGTIEEFYLKNKNKTFDILTLTWTLCNTSDCYEVIRIASKLVKKNGHIVVAESSRILVPFKKPIHMYFSKQEQDTHAFHFSKNSLVNLLKINYFKPIFVNRYIDSDCLVVIAKKTNVVDKKGIKLDNPNKLQSFFKDWYKDSLKYKAYKV
jgi:2-polyprenyl-3-methyl-5-hydroxy-6-metoxy-1,4-benzoquinol methylase